MEERCRNCAYHDDFSGVCFCGDSPNVADFTLSDDYCEAWAENNKKVEEKIKKSKK